MKYIRFNHPVGVILFEDKMTHHVIKEIVDPHNNIGCVSAGFVEFDGNHPFAVGESESIGLESKDEDTRIIRAAMAW